MNKILITILFAFYSLVTLAAYTITIDDIVFENGVIIDYLNVTEKDIVIPDNFNDEAVISIGQSAFFNNQLTSISIPNTVMSIGQWAFRQNRLTSVVIPNSVTEVGVGAFARNSLTAVTMSDSVISIGRIAFANNQLTNIVIPNSVTRIEEDVFIWNNFDQFKLPTQHNGYSHAWNNGDYISGDAVSVQGAYEIGEIITGLESSNTNNELTFFPNPCSKFIHINFNEQALSSIYSLNGTLILTSKQSKINVSHLAPGVYLISQGQKKSKLIKK